MNPFEPKEFPEEDSPSPEWIPLRWNEKKIVVGGHELVARTEDDGPCYEGKKMREEETFTTKAIQWSSSNGQIFFPTSTTVDVLSPGYYEVGNHDQLGLYFEKVPIKLDGILRLSESIPEKILNEVQTFWMKEDVYRKHDITYKRGIILYGSPGGGKSTILQMVSKDVIDRQGIVIKFTYTSLFKAGYRKLREIQPEVPIVVLMEDIDALIRSNSESEVLNILDGVDKLHKVVFLATTNYPEELGDRIINRPSRFDRRFCVEAPVEESRKKYFEFLNKETQNENVDCAGWAKKTEGFTISHLKELFVAVAILGNSFDDTLMMLKRMDIRPSSDNDRKKSVGFRSATINGC